MRIINFGSINYDRTYRVKRFPSAGETTQSLELLCGCGGKGLNQSIAASRAGAAVVHAGAIGEDGAALEETMRKNGVDTSRLLHVNGEQGHAVIIVDESGENEILVHRGSNLKLDHAYVDSVICSYWAPSIVLLQNEIPHAGYIIERAFSEGMTVALNASPVTEDLTQNVNFSHVHWLIINEVEGEQLTGHRQPEEIISRFQEQYPEMNGVLTLGTAGSVWWEREKVSRLGSYKVPVTDTTGAGDAFTGYFLAGIAEGKSTSDAVKTATMAAGLSVTRPGAAGSIPEMEEVKACLAEGRILLRNP